MIVKFPKKVLNDDVWNYIDSAFWKDLITWIIHSKYRDAVNLKLWISEMSYPEVEIKVGQSTDETMLTILRWTRNNIVYKGDSVSWSMEEYWQTADETINRMAGDCEDGAVLMYKIARSLGVPANRLMIMAGDVYKGKHCWLAYKPDCYPLNWVFLDWCNFVDLNDIDSRRFFYINGNVIEEETLADGVVTPKYLNIWFAFNELGAHSELRYKPHDY